VAREKRKKQEQEGLTSFPMLAPQYWTSIYLHGCILLQLQWQCV
jgi:hypothetical protein